MIESGIEAGWKQLEEFGTDQRLKQQLEEFGTDQRLKQQLEEFGTDQRDSITLGAMCRI